MKREVQLEKVFGTDHFRSYYWNYRNKYSDLFASEKHFFGDFARGARRLLDVGCATGGMYAVMAELEPAAEYVGCDIAEHLLEEARRLFPQGDFRRCDGAELPFETSSFDRVVSLGTTVHDQFYAGLISECYRVTSDLLLFDVRVTRDHATLASVERGYVLDGVGIRYPYVVVNWDELIALLTSLKPAAINAFGYWGRANTNAHLPEAYGQICFATVLVQKGNSREGPPAFSLELPF